MVGDLRVGLVGAGMVSQFHIAGWLACPNANLVGIADPDLERAQGRAASVPGAQAFRSMKEMLHLGLDAVDIVAPPHLHATLIAEALSHDLHVVCQKPLAPSHEEAVRIVRALPDTPRVMVHENWRWRASYRELKQHLEQPRTPKPDRFTLRVESSGLLKDSRGRYPALERQPFFADLDRFLVIELLVHHLDTIEFLFGPVTIESARLDHRCPEIRGEDFAEIKLSAGGIPGTLLGDFCVPGAPPLPKDRLQLSSDLKPSVDGWMLRLPGCPPRTFEADAHYQDSYSATIAHFSQSLRDETPFETPPEHALHLLELVEAIYAHAIGA